MSNFSVTCDIQIDHLSFAFPKIKPDQIVIKDTKINIQFDYPCNPSIFTFKSKKGFSLYKIAMCIAEGYNKIYANESKYETWGHSMDDLALEGFYYNEKKNLITLSMGS